MSFRILLAIAAVATIASGAARADEADASQYAVQFQGTRTKAEVQAEAATVSATRSIEPAGSRVAAPVKSGIDAKEVRAQAAQALRQGLIPRGEAG